MSNPTLTENSVIPAYSATSLWREPLEKALQEDQWQWDWTAMGALRSDPLRQVTARVVAKSEGIWAADGLDITVVQLAKSEGMTLECRNRLRAGESFSAGQEVTVWSGPAHALLSFERSYLNLAAWTSGIATQTAQLVSQVREVWGKLSEAQTRSPTGQKWSAPRVTSTRKTLPGYRDLSVRSVMAGGGMSHRVSLASGLLIKENHIAAAGGVGHAIRGVKEIAPHGLRVEIEVTSQAELQEAIECGVDAVLLDNFRPVEVRNSLKWLHQQPSGERICVEVSGGIACENIAEYIIPGVSVISSGSLTHSVRVADLSMLVDWK
jgi:nicotinate-nucleotide pyrophosphorylase (carboxylating)